MTDERRLGPFRWRGSLNWKDVTERIIAGAVVGVTAGVTMWLLERLPV
ncbi:hypothetical protein LCGC14_0532510 [marine sediment metagenome]|uniref:Uncharacterized protein n=1 Tax=marine sediment metagenome TaxID=412755 RepID=A0A0F9SDQ1_9ZZZZ